MNLGTRCLAVWLGLTAVAAALEVAMWPVLAGGTAAVPFEDVLVRGCAAVAVSVTAWLWLVVTMVLLDALRGAAPTRRGVPDAVRRGVLLLCGAAVTAGLAAPAVATDGSPAGPAGLSGLRLPERIAVERLAPRPPPPAPVVAVPQDDLVVRSGDTLWSLTADRLGSGATPEAIAAGWPRLYAVNRGVIGPDPDRIEPGQRLVWPHEGADHDRH